ncbi:MAG: hypothetical protein DI536_10020 [Archangium gephyra]|uniref:Lipoprotein n=1 Tax=Archangium gephyra TaxID=48 RepID=A0A2W5UYV7_9BACT|nr:MAG: hypothetical protein DI536_10020 [Archangium gephyra]
MPGSMRFVLLTLLLLTGCADVCARAELMAVEFPERHGACFPDGTLPGPAFDAKVCDSSMNACSPGDEQRIHTYFDCVEKLAPCTPETKADFTSDFLGCTTGMNRLSSGCFAQ